MTQELTRLSRVLANHFCEDFKEHVRDEIAYNNYHSANMVMANPEKFPKANFAALEERATEIALFWPEVLYQPGMAA